MIKIQENFNIKRAVSGYIFLSSRDYEVLTDAFKTICKKLESDTTLELYFNQNNTTSDLRRLFDERLELFISDFIDFSKSDGHQPSGVTDVTSRGLVELKDLN